MPLRTAAMTKPRSATCALPVVALAALVATLVATPLTAQRNGGEIKPGPWNTANKVPEGWVIYESRYYQVQSQAGLEKAKRLAEHMEVMNAVYRSMFRPDKGGAKRQAIKLLKDRQAFLQYGAPPGAGAYYSPMDREMVCYDTGKWSDEEKIEAAVTGPDAAKGAAARRRAQMEDIMKMDILGAAARGSTKAWATTSTRQVRARRKGARRRRTSAARTACGSRC